MSPFTRILFPRPSFLDGFGRIFDFAGALNLYNQSRTPAEADQKALEADWSAVAADMWTAVEEAEKDFRQEQDRRTDGQTA